MSIQSFTSYFASFTPPESIMAQQVRPALTHNLSDGGKTAIVTSVVFSSLATIAVGLRFYVRRIKRTGVFVEDWLLLSALVFRLFMGRSLT